MDLGALSRKEIQHLAKQQGIKANQKTEVLIRLLGDHTQQDDESTSPGKQTAGQASKEPVDRRQAATDDSARKRVFAALDTEQDSVVDAAECPIGLKAGMTDAGASYTAPAAAKQNTAAAPASTLSLEQKERIAQNREAAKRRRQAATASKAAEVTASKATVQPECSDCGAHPQFGELCIVWHHSGTIQRESGEPHSRFDRFRWTCCGRLDPQPCFIGGHGQAGLGCQLMPVPGMDRCCEWRQPHQATARCYCEEVAPLRRTRKEGHNNGRYFFGCGVGRGGCKYFKWADQLYGVARPPAWDNADGVDELSAPFANPLGENMAAQCDTDQKQRQRLIAAVLFRELCVLVQRGRQSVFRRQLIEQAVDIFTTFELKVALHPITTRQACIRFGEWQVLPPNKPQALDSSECNGVLDLLLQSRLVKSVVKTRDVDSETMHDQAIGLRGLESYLSV